MTPITAKFLANVCRIRHADEISLGDAIELIRMIQQGDLIHIDTLAAAAEAQGYRLEPIVVPIRPVATPEAVWTPADWANSRGGM